MVRFYSQLSTIDHFNVFFPLENIYIKIYCMFEWQRDI